TVTESGEVDGITNDSAAETGKTVTVTVVDNGDGTLTATASSTEEEPLTFTNTYSVEPTTAEIPVTKTVESETEGTEPKAWSYDFTLSASGEKITLSGEGNESQDGKFAAIEFTAPGTYEYTITESGTVAGITNDEESVKTVTVEVVDNNDGTMTATVKGADDGESDATTFTNTYNVTPTSAVIPVKKTVESETEGTAPGAWSYDFTLSGDDVDETVTISGTGNTSGSKNYTAIEYTEPGTYTYTIEEAATEGSENAGIENGTTSYTVTVTVEDNGDGTLSAYVNGKDSTEDDTTEFTNTYKIEPASVEIPVQKTVESDVEDAEPASWTFSFTLKDSEGTEVGSIEISGSGNSSETESFDEIEYTEPGTYTYTVTESGEVDGITNDSAAETGKTVTVTVVDNGDGTLTATASSTEEEPLTFTNTYSVEPTTVSFPVQKILEVPEGLDGPASWSFNIKVEAQDGAPSAATMTGTVTDKADTVTFGDFTYTKPGDYTYKVTETGTVAGVTNDPDATRGKTVTVTVTDNGDGTMTAEADFTADEPLTFTNTYSVEPVVVDPPVAKILSAESGFNPPDITGKFTFTISGSEPLPENTSITNSDTYASETVAGAYEFGEIEFTEPGTYTYTVTESGSVPGVTNDSEAEKTWTFTVTDNGDGTLKVTPTTDQAYWTFTNTYVPEPVKVPIPVIKTITKTNASRGEVTFTFTLTGNGPLPETNTLDIEMEGSETGTADGEFGEITFTKPGTYTYTISETELPKGWSADGDKSGTVTVIVTDNGEGTLEAEISETVEIKNQYQHRDHVPKTDDNTNLDKWGIGAAICAAGFAGVELIDAIVKKRRKEEDEAK
ncbi:MAG: VCBS domain-containing protein, partial [Oscillospiraceae bacterium]|nr:VCBS domain-containing protein [Oscillospiraceae bacterium]